MKETERIIEIDIAKGICILLMVIGHSGMTGIPLHMIYAFHIAILFLALYGIIYVKNLFPIAKKLRL